MSYVFVGHKTTNKNNEKLLAYITRENVCIERICEEPYGLVLWLSREYSAILYSCSSNNALKFN